MDLVVLVLFHDVFLFALRILKNLKRESLFPCEILRLHCVCSSYLSIWGHHKRGRTNYGGELLVCLCNDLLVHN